MTKREHSCFLEYRFEVPAHLNEDIICRLEYANSKFDKVIVSNGGISFAYKRLSSHTRAHAQNTTRVKWAKKVLLAMNCADGVGDSVKIASAFYSIDESMPAGIELDGNLAGLDLAYGGRKYPQIVLVASLGTGDLAKALRIAISYCWAAAKAFSQEERLKLLWGAFNALYRYQTKRGRDLDGLDDAAKLFLEDRFLNRALCVYSNEIRPLDYRLFVRWKMLTGDRSRALYIKKDERTRNKSAKGKRLAQFDRETLACMRDYGCGDVEGKAALKAEINDHLERARVDADDLNKVVMLLCRYIYILRCDGVHANVEYPIFDVKRSEEKRVLSNLLEAAVVDFAEWLTENDVL